MRRMIARPMDFTDRVTSTTAFSWAWDRGPAGDMVTVGADIASAENAVAAITAVAAAWPITAVLRVAVVVIFTAMQRLLIPAERVPAHLTTAAVADRTQHRHVAVVAADMLAVAVVTPVAVDMRAADTGRR